ncbi:polycystin-1-like protein 2 isoform X2 [Branchiostoma floridae x Branchiostoma japonicum]
MPKDSGTNVFLESLTTAGSYWIGLNDQDVEGQWRWEDGTTLDMTKDFSSWAVGEPNNRNGQHCVRHYGELLWDDDHCQITLKVLCQINLAATTTSTSTTVVGTVCPVEWSVFNGKCYKVFNEKRTYSQATEVCNDHGGRLAMVKDSATNIFLKTLSSDHRWFGLSDQDTEGQFLWEDGTSLASTGFTDWGGREPNGGTGENCVQYWGQNSWNDRGCNEPLGFTCEVQACPVGYSPHGGFCYKVFEELQTYDGARQVCAADSGTLAIIKDLVTNDFLVGLTTEGGAFYIGLNDLNAEGQFRWEDGTMYDNGTDFSNWAQGEPNNSGDQDCIKISPGGRWGDVECGVIRKFICQINRATTPTPAPTPVTACPDGYIQYSAFCFKAVEELKTFEEARQLCAMEGTHLAMPKDKGRNVFVESLTTADPYWIGLNDMDVEGQWRWEDGTALDMANDFSSWAVGEPNSNGEQHCVRHYDEGLWDDNQCHDTLKVLCQINLACPGGYSLHGSFCYKAFDELKTNNGARQVCSEDSGRLAIIKDNITNAFLAGLITADNYYIGLNDLNIEGQFRWEDGTVYNNDTDFSNWSPGEPDNSGNQDCVKLSGDGLWGDKDCTIKRKFICQINLAPKKWREDSRCGEGYPAPNGDPAECNPSGARPCCSPHNWCGLNAYHCDCEGCVDYRSPGHLSDWVKHGSRSYKFLQSTFVSYTEARALCAAEDAKIAMPKDQETHDFIVQYRNQFYNNINLWIGLNDINVEGDFVWEDGTPLGSSSRWFPRQPNNGHGLQHCAVLTPETNPYPNQWRDDDCSYTRGAICERGCPTNYTQLNDSCFKAFEDPKTFSESREACAAQGGLLAMSKDRVTNDFLASLMQPDLSYWLGLMYHDAEKKWRWEDGSVYDLDTDFRNWNPGEPNNMGGQEHCAYLTTRYTWNDYRCHNNFNYICQIQTATRPTPTPTSATAEGGLCSGAVCADHAVCVQSEEKGELQCTCRNGYSGDGTVECQDIDECSDGTHKCSRVELCFNTEGSHRCAQCYPDFTVQGGAETSASAVTILRRVGFYLRVETDIDCNVEYAVSFAWTIWSGDGSDIKQLNTTGKLKTSAHEIAVPKNFLPLGLNMLRVVITVLENGSGLSLNRSLERWVRIISSPIEARIAGGSARSVSFGSSITLNASVSYDPDNIIRDSGLFNYSWSCSIGEALPCNDVFRNVSTKAVYVIPSGTFGPNDTITFTVDVSFAGRSPGVYTQTIHLAVEDPTISLRCNSNCNSRINPSERLALLSVCENCLLDEQLLYNWTLQRAPPGFGRSVLHWDTDTTTGRFLPDLVVQADVFTKPGQYVLRVDVTRAKGATGFAEYLFEPNTPPTAGTCSVSPETGVAMVDEFSVQCTGFADSDLPMTYAFYYNTGGQRLVAINSTAEDDELSLFYSGPVPSTPPRLFPVGLPSRDYNVTILVRASDALGAQAAVSLVVKVFPLPTEETTNVATQLTVGANSTLGRLVQGGNFQAAVQVSNSVNSVLNAEAANATEKGKQNATQVRSSIISSLSEFKVQSVSSVNILANALSQATVVQEEVSAESQVKAAASLVDLVGIMQNQPEEELGIEEAEESSVFLTSALVNVMRASSYSSVEAKTKLTGRTKTDKLQQTQTATGRVFEALDAMNDVVLRRKRPNEKPTLLQQDNFELSLRKQTCDQMSPQIVTTTEANGGWFRTPDASVLFGENTCKEPIDSETYQTTLNPYEYAGDSDRIQSSVGALKYKNDAGVLAVSNLESPVEVVVKRKGAVQVQTEQGRTGRTGTGFMSIHSFNVTEEENSIHVMVTPDLKWVPIRLYLWRQDQPIRGQHGWNVTLPLSPDQLYSVRWLDGENITADPYSWYWTPEDLASGDGETYYLGVEHVPFNNSGFDLSDLEKLENGTSTVELSYSDENFTLPYTVAILSTRCLFFDDQRHRWKSDGCRIGPLTNTNITHCFCDHLTAFGSDFQFFVAPNSLNILQALQGFNNISENPAVVITISVIVGIYILMVVWARWKDRKDVEKVGATVLGTSPGGGCSVYQVVVFTGARANAGTTAKVSVIFYGEKGESGPHELDDVRRMTFCTGGVDSFVVTCAGVMGPLNYIHVWHDNSGDDPSWFLNKIIVTDVYTERKYYFLCNKWFAVEEGDGKVERVFPVASDRELKRFKTIFSSKTGTGFRDDHLWFSVLGRPAYSTFSRVQRISCCLSLLLCTMLANIMFFGTGDSFQKPPTVDIFGFDVQLPISWAEIMIAIESALLVFPVNLAIVQIFRHCGPRPARPRKIDRGKGGERSRQSESSYGQSSSVPSSPVTVITDITDDDRELVREILSSYKTPSQRMSLKSAKAKSRSSKSSKTSREENASNLKRPLSEDGSYNVKQAGSAKRKTKTKKTFLLPWWCVYIGWFLVFSSCFVSAFFTILYGFEYGRQKAEAWLFTFLTSFFFDLVITQPIKILLLGMFFALIIKKIDTSGEDVAPMPIQEDEEYLAQDTREMDRGTRSMTPRATGPPDDQELLKARQQRFLELSLRSALMELSFFITYVFILILVANGNRDFYMYHMINNVKNVLVDPFSQITERQDFWNFMKDKVVPELHTSEWYNGEAIDSSKLGFLSDYSSYIVGPVQLRQLRVQQSGTCEIPSTMTNITSRCNGDYSWWNNEAGHYTPGWRGWALVSNNSVDVANLSSELKPWLYQSSNLTTATPHYGLHGMYYGGGYMLELQSNDSDLDLQIIEDLEMEQWIDSYTRAIFIELIVFNPNANLFSVVSLLAEFPGLGKVYTSHEVTTVRLYLYQTMWSFFVLAFQIIFVLVTFIFVYREVNRIMLMGTDYFRLFWNLVELCVCLLSLAQIGLQLYTLYIILDFNKAGTTSDRSYSKYKQAASWDQLNTYVQAWLVCAATLKLMHLCRFNKHVERSAHTLTRSAKPMLNYMIIFVIYVSAFCMLTYLVLGASLEGYAPYITNVETMLGVMLGGFDYNALSDAHGFLGPVIFFGYLTFVNFLLLMMFCAILDVAYHEVVEGESEEEKSKNQKITELAMERARVAYQRAENSIQGLLVRETHVKHIRGSTPAYTKEELMEDLLQARRKALSFIRSMESEEKETNGYYDNLAYTSNHGYSKSTKESSDSVHLESERIPGCMP